MLYIVCYISEYIVHLYYIVYAVKYILTVTLHGI